MYEYPSIIFAYCRNMSKTQIASSTSKEKGETTMPYCQHCGAKLEDGQTCTCEMAQAAANQQPPQPEQPQQTAPQATPPAESPVSIVFKKFKRYIASYISNPEQAVRSVMAEEYDFTLPIVLTVIRLLAMGLAIYGFLSKICKIVFTFMTTSILRYSSSADILTASLTASLPKCLFFGALIAAIGMFLFIIMLYALVKIQNDYKMSFSDLFRASAANGVPISALLLLSFLVSFISPAPALILIGLAMLCWIISGVRTARIVSPNNSTGTFALLYFIGVALVILVGYFVIPFLFRQAVGGITASYMGESIALQDVFDTMAKNLKDEFAEDGVRNWNQFFSMALRQFFEEFSSELWYSITSTFKQ